MQREITLNIKYLINITFNFFFVPLPVEGSLKRINLFFIILKYKNTELYYYDMFVILIIDTHLTEFNKYVFKIKYDPNKKVKCLSDGKMGLGS